MTSFGAQAHSSPVPDNDDYRQLANLRDVAGLRLAGGGLVPAGVLYRSDAPYPGDAVPGTVPHWPPATVIDLRSTGEAAARYRWPAGVTVHHVPLMRQAAVVGTDDSATRPGRPLPASLAVVYRRMLDMIPHRLAALPGMAADSGGPVLVHCAAGKDRTGVAVQLSFDERFVGCVERMQHVPALDVESVTAQQRVTRHAPHVGRYAKIVAQQPRRRFHLAQDGP